MNKSSLSQIILFVALFFLTFLFRTVWHLGANIEFVTCAMILSSYYLGKKSTFWLVLLIMVCTDLVLGNTNIFIFTWSGFLIPTIVFPKLFQNSKFKIQNSLLKIIFLTGTGILANLFFYIYTNLGVWFLDSWGMYSKNLQGLILCYMNALPFLKYQLVSSLIFIPIGFVIMEFLPKLLRQFKFFPNISAKKSV